MIRTHVPRGPVFRCPSNFQRTHEIRSIVYDGCLAPPIEAIIPDEEDDWTSSDRTAKRQKIEGLAHSYLDGEPLFISSALSFAWPRSTRKAVETEYYASTGQEANQALWEDVDDPYLHCQEHISGVEDGQNRSSRPKRGALSGQNATVAVTSEKVVPKGRTPAPRQRKTRTVPQRRKRPQLLSMEQGETSITDIASQPQDTGAVCEPAVKPAPASPARPLNEPFTTQQNTADGNPNAAHENDGPISNGVVSDSNKPDWHSKRANDAPSISAQSETFHPAEGASREEPSQEQFLRTSGIRAAPRKSWASTNGSSTTPLPSALGNAALEGTIAPPFTSASPAAPISAQKNAWNIRKTPKSATRGRKKGLSTSTRRKTAPSESQRSIDSDISVVKNRKPTLDKSEATKRLEETSESPFAFKRGARAKAANPKVPDDAHNRKAEERTGKKPPRRMAFHSSDNVQTAAQRKPTVTPAPPVLDFSFGHDSSFGPGLNMALVNEHLNAVLPDDRHQEGRSSAIKRALREELRKSGAEIIRPIDEPASSQLEHEPAQESEHTNGSTYEEQIASVRKAAESQNFWAGTQNLLAQAQQDLLNSPSKRPLPDAVVLGRAPSRDERQNALEKQEIAAVLQSPDVTRPALARLSQEPAPAPSTQALFEEWQPWSTVKKGGPSGRGTSFAESPVTAFSDTTETPTSPRLAGSTTQRSMKASGARPRKSGLRQSLSMPQTPVPSTIQRSGVETNRQQGGTSVRQSNPQGTECVRTLRPTGTPLGSSRQHEGTTEISGRLDWSETEVSTGEPLPSFQAAQRSMIRDDSNAEETLTEVAENMLSLGDMTGVVSEVSWEHSRSSQCM